MPLRDHFHPPFSTRYSWDVVNGMLPMMIAKHLNGTMPEEYQAGPLVNLGSVRTMFVESQPEELKWVMPTFVYRELRWSDVDEYEVQVHNRRRWHELVAAVVIVSPSNKDTHAHRRHFAAKCASHLSNGVSVTVLDFVTEEGSNLFAEMLDLFGQTDFPRPTEGIYALPCRVVERQRLEVWYHPLVIGQPLPAIPLWLTHEIAMPLDLEPLYEQTLKSLRIK